MIVNWQNHIVSTPNVLSGKPRICDTRIPVGLILGYLAMGKTAAEIIEEFSDLTQEQILACLDYARDLVDGEGLDIPTIKGVKFIGDPRLRREDMYDDSGR